MENIVTAIVGIACIIIGILNRKGNLSMLHAYHRKRVSEEDKLPFGKLVGLGMIIVGIALIFFGGLSFVESILQKSVYSIIGIISLIVGLAVGLGIIFYAIKKYNKGIF